MTEPNSIYSKIVFEGRLKTISPLAISSGEGAFINSAVTINPVDGRPCIPSSSFCGCLATRLRSLGISPLTERYLLGFAEEENNDDRDSSLQSHIAVDELWLAPNVRTRIAKRDGVRIDQKNSNASPGGKYDYEIVSPDTEFLLRGEITIRNRMEKNAAEIRLYANLIETILNTDFSLGSMTTSGLGEVELVPKSWAIREFIAGEDFDDWLNYNVNEELKASDDDGPRMLGRALVVNKELHAQAAKKVKGSYLRVKASFSLKSSILTGSNYTTLDTNKEQLSESFLNEDGEEVRRPVLSGKAVRGAILHRSRLVLDAIADDSINPDSELEGLFGFVREERSNNPAAKSRIWVGETILAESMDDLSTQVRVSIDRFTGGAIERLLFSSAPLWNGKAKNTFTIRMRIPDAEEWEIGLLLQIIKDLWTEDLAIGGEKSIGRGILVGQSAEIKFPNDMVFHIEKPAESESTQSERPPFLEPKVKLESGTKKKLEVYAKALWSKYN